MAPARLIPAALVALLVAGAGDPARGQDPLPFPPEKFFEQLFGAGEAAIDEAELGKIEVPSEEEAQLGQQGLDDIRRQLAGRKAKLRERGRDVHYLQRLVESLRPQMKEAERYRKLHVYLAEVDEPEAYTLPGGHILFSRGLLEQATCEAALAVVAGHELSHLDRGHLLRRTRQWKLAQQRLAGPAGGFSPDKLLQTTSLMQQLFRRPFGPEEELEADRDGITWAYRAGYDPRAVTAVYEAIARRGAGQPDFMPTFFRTHPQSAERNAALKETFGALQAAEPAAELYLGRENLRRRVVRGEREFAE